MNPTPTGGATSPSPDGREPGAEVGTDDDPGRPVGDAGAPDDGDGLPPLPAPRAARPLPRRPRGASPPSAGSEQGSPRDPDGRPFDQLDEDTLTRLLSGLREI
jgi:hypothetical protein